MHRNLWFLMLAVRLLSAQVQLQFPQPSGGTYTTTVILPNGEPLLVGTSTTVRQAIALSAIGPTPFQGGLPADALPVLGGSANDIPAAAAVDPMGNIWIAGSTNSDDFNLVNPIASQKVPYRTAGFVIELDPTGLHLLFATYLCGSQTYPSQIRGPFSSYATSIVFDASGNAYVAGATNEADFPLTSGAFQNTGGKSFGGAFYEAFVTKISPAGKLIYSTLLGGKTGNCSSPDSCLGATAYSIASSLAVDASGSVTLAGITNSPGFPTTAGALQRTCDTVDSLFCDPDGFVSRLSSDFSNLLSSTYIGSAAFGFVSSLFMAQDSQGNVDLFGQYAPYARTGVPANLTPGLFTAQLSSDGSRLIKSTDLGQSLDVAAYGIMIDSAGIVYLSGTSSSSQVLSVPNALNLGADFVLTLKPSGTQTLVRLPAGTLSGPVVFDASSGNLLLISSQIALLQLPVASPTSAPAVVGFSNSASLVANRGLRAGELISLYGFNLASTAQVASPGASAVFPTTLGGVQVLVNGYPAPLLYVGPNQINLQVPFETYQKANGPDVQIQVILPAVTLVMQVKSSAAIGLFTPALNQDGTLNSAANPAKAGSIVTLFGTGIVAASGLADGALATTATPYSQVAAQFQVVDSQGVEASIFYAGTAPGLIDGVFQLNVQLPFGEPTNHPVSLTLKSGAIASNKVQIYIQ
jgi:uncharacterized protein (TIGR03437 family)